MNVKDFIKSKLREGATQTDIAKKCGLSNGTITKILYSDTKQTIDTIKKISTAYNTPISFFINETGPLAIMQPSIVDGIRQYPDPFKHNDQDIPLKSPTINEIIGEGYTPAVRWIADTVQMLIKDKPEEEQRRIALEEIKAFIERNQ